MSVASNLQTAGAAADTETAALERFGLRWAVLAAWRDELSRRGLRLAAPVSQRLEASRVKISSGCFSVCEVGCDLSAIERDLGAADASSASDSMTFWIDLLGRAMSDPVEVEKLMRIPAVKANFVNCGPRACRCDN